MWLVDFCFYKVHFRKYGYKQKKIDNSHEIACEKERPIKFLEIKKCLIKDDVTIFVKVYNSIFVLDENGCFIENIQIVYVETSWTFFPFVYPLLVGIKRCS